MYLIVLVFISFSVLKDKFPIKLTNFISIIHLKNLKNINCWYIVIIIGWLHTGDLGFYDERGEICISGRIKETIKYQNHQISSAEIESVLQNHPDVLDVAVVPVPHEIDTERPMAYVRKISGSMVVFIILFFTYTIIL